MRIAVAITCLASSPVLSLCAESKPSVPRTHAHNDYQHERPLIDALQQGFVSVEADVHLVDGQLLVAHDRNDVAADRTLQQLYLDPLRTRIEKNGGSVHGDGQRFTLLIDIKSDGESTYRAIDALLAQYADILTHTYRDRVQHRPVTAIISGNRAFEAIQSDPTRFAGIDGRLSDLNSDASADLMPMISDHWGKHFKWRGEGEMSANDHEKLLSVIRQAHQHGRLVRFWATPDLAAMWAALESAEVDLINTDDLAGLSRHLRGE